jgi:hypothetical protein
LRIAYALLLVAGMVAWLAVEYTVKPNGKTLNGLGQGLSDAFTIEPQPTNPANGTQSICLCSYPNKRDNLAHSWGAPYGQVVPKMAGLPSLGQAKLSPSIFWKYCPADVPPPNTSTAAGILTNRVLLSFCFQLFDMRIAPPVSSIQWSRDSFNNTRLAEARSK